MWRQSILAESSMVLVFEFLPLGPEAAGFANRCAEKLYEWSKFPSELEDTA